MKEAFLLEDVKTRLLLSGVKELSEYGARDFSLRRAAEAAGVSCAAPYRYFKGKEEYVVEIISYLASRWELMADEITKAGGESAKELISELCAANVRFWLSNKNLRTALIMSGEEKSTVKPSVFDKRIVAEIRSYLNSLGVSAADCEMRITAIRALLIGYLTLIGSGELPNNEETFRDIKTQTASLI